MFDLKPLHPDAVAAALARAERYRLLNEPSEAESICLDVLAVDPDNQAARIMLLLALTDQFDDAAGAHRSARELLAGLTSDYDRAYYAGIIAERRAKAQFARTGAAASAGVYDWLTEAMDHFERAEALRQHGNDDARLRWNACVRFIQRHPQLRSSVDDRREIEMLE
jgi:predicted Zn-dependent protease